eukprot:TRINITY_DN92027_c0_g1_i1.p2 TRINITY_DN92027_c0_g1~~TRINITY_DN92027_c0_g1_i1.p2  ORF type:complete len:155 (-),score=29.83 TRINITY_DN92027_c0_g1_i1:352-816(-)
MAAPGDDPYPGIGDFTKIGHAQVELNGAIQMMRQNMQTMVERDSSLQHLESQSSSLHGTASSFTRQAHRLQWEMRWRKIRLAILAVALVLWAVAFFVLRKHMKLMHFAAASVVFFALLWGGERLLVRRWHSQMEMEQSSATGRGSGSRMGGPLE